MEKPSRAPRLKGRRGTESRVGLMRINNARGVLMGRVTDVGLASPHDVLWNHCRDQRVQVTRWVTRALRQPQRGTRARSGTSSKGAAYRLAIARQPPSRSGREPARLEMAKEVPRDLTSRPTTSRPDKESWDFDGNKLTSARRRTRRSPMLTHETSPVSGASVVGMTYGACQGPSYLPAGVPGVSTALGEKTGSARRAGCASSRLATPPRRAGAGR
jgi:hypothetical protein